MRSRYRCVSYALLALFLVGGGVLFFRDHYQYDIDPWIDPQVLNAKIIIDKTTIDVHIARTPEAQSDGLSNTPSLAYDRGELFIFDTPGKYGFWMKDMQYPLDFLWIDASHRIIAITSSVAPDTYPTVFYPPEPVTSVLEVNAGFSTLHSISIGDMVLLEK